MRLFRYGSSVVLIAPVGYDEEGAYQLNRELLDTNKWIGTAGTALSDDVTTSSCLLGQQTYMWRSPIVASRELKSFLVVLL